MLTKSSIIDIIALMFREGVTIYDDIDKSIVKQLNYINIDVKFPTEEINSQVALCNNEKNGNEISVNYKYVISGTTVIFIINLFKYGIPNDLDSEFFYDHSTPFNGYESPYTQKQDEKFIEKTITGDLLNDIDLNIEEQVSIAKDLSTYVQEFKSILQVESAVYKWNNGWFEGSDGLALFYMMRKFRPKRIIEIGSGWSTALMLDIKNKYNSDTKIQCIEPFPWRLQELGIEDNVELFKDYVQNIDLDVFENLEANDFLFIDSSHVIKTGGDIPFEYFCILPRLRKGVLVHIHDMHFPFTYPKWMIHQGRPYNEAYLVRALLSGNDTYKVLFFGNLMCKQKMYEKLLYEYPELKVAGGSLWIQKTK